MPTDYTPKLQAAKAKLQAKGMLMQFVRRTEDTSQMPEPGGGYPVIETRTDFYGLKTSPMLAEVQMGIFAGEDLVVVMPGDVCEGARIPRTSSHSWGNCGKSSRFTS